MKYDLRRSLFSFLDNIGRIGDRNYIPTHKDILMSRAQTAGVVEILFPIKNYTMK